MQRALLAPVILTLACNSGGGGVEDSGNPRDTGGAPLDGTTDFARLTDELDGDSLDPKWSVYRPEVADVGLESGQLVIRMTQGALWFMDQTSVLVYQDVTGDFSLESAVYARSTASPGSPPDRPVQLGGIIARDGASDRESYVFVVVGFDENDLSVETKSTRDGNSDYNGPSWPSGDAELRLCRSGDQFRLFKRPIGGTSWELAETYVRPDLPATLQVGAIAYSFDQPDVTVRFDALRFAPSCQ